MRWRLGVIRSTWGCLGRQRNTLIQLIHLKQTLRNRTKCGTEKSRKRIIFLRKIKRMKLSSVSSYFLSSCVFRSLRPPMGRHFPRGCEYHLCAQHPWFYSACNMLGVVGTRLQAHRRCRYWGGRREFVLVRPCVRNTSFLPVSRQHEYAA